MQLSSEERQLQDDSSPPKCESESFNISKCAVVVLGCNQWVRRWSLPLPEKGCC